MLTFNEKRYSELILVYFYTLAPLESNDMFFSPHSPESQSSLLMTSRNVKPHKNINDMTQQIKYSI